ncbi:MAG: ATP-binding cassette domain-containing protein [Thermoleophilia bacterium]|nr:ATP-binding cassette domain-containing protein [Thermoleophilia bacterium]MDH5332638.1 ATP-binding cassette domain-containing protein [Thermoleophilia bacterium]
MDRRLSLRSVSVWRWQARSGTRVPILDGVDWDVGSGERWALLGPNGAGKTTLLTVAGAVEFPSRGDAVILGRTLGRTDVFRLREEIGFVDARAGRRFAPALTVRDVVQTGATQTIGWFPERLDAAGRARVEALLDQFGLTGLAERRFADCSHGERTRTLIARALVPRPRLLLLDEPGSGLDLAGRETLLGALDRLVAEEPELALVTTTHHLEELPATTTHALLLRAGRVTSSGPVSATLTGEALTACFGLGVDVRGENGRWSAVAASHG